MYQRTLKLVTFNDLLKIVKLHVKKYSNCINVNDVYIIAGSRTPIGSFQGKLADFSMIELGTKALKSAIEKSCIDSNAVQELVLGNCFPGGCGQAPAYQMAMNAGLPDTIVHSTVNKLCGSGLKAIINACQIIATNTQELVIAGGVESLSNAPYVLKRRLKPLGNIQLKDTILKDGLIDPWDHVDVTSFVEETIKEYKVTREDQDNYALSSYEKAAKAQKNKVFAAEMVPIRIKVKNRKEDELMCDDEEVGRLNVEKFRCLEPEAGKGGTITPGNTSALADGAAMVILANGNYLLKKGLKPLAKIVSYGDSTVHRKQLTLAPSVAVRRALIRANLNADQIDVWEISETFAVTALLNAKILRLDMERVNPHGGTISLGHPFGMTGVRLIIHLAYTLQPGKLGCATISHATGGATAIIIEKFC